MYLHGSKENIKFRRNLPIKIWYRIPVILSYLINRGHYHYNNKGLLSAMKDILGHNNN